MFSRRSAAADARHPRYSSHRSACRRSSASSAFASARRALRSASRHFHVTPLTPTTATATATAASPAANGFRFAHRPNRSTLPTGRAWIGRPSRYRLRSSANSSAVGYRPAADLAMHFRQMVSRSRGRVGRSRDGGTGSWYLTSSIVSVRVNPWNGRRAVSNSYRMTPSA